MPAMPALRSLLHAAIDYAGLFPPAGLDMPAAVRNYAAYRDSPDRWALGRFVLPLGRLGEFETAAEDLLPRTPSDDGWPLAVLLGDGSRAETQALGEFNCRHAARGEGAASGDVVELKAQTVDDVERILGGLPAYLTAYVEIPVHRDPADLVAAIARKGGRAKVRTGGVTPDAFPSPRELVGFLRACVAHDLPFKATAGLHHPLRAEYRLTYEPDSPRGTMYGFLNLFLAAAWLREGMSDGEAERLLEERSADALEVTADGVKWRGHRLDEAAIARARERGIVSFGSCSFTEPVEELEGLGWPA